ncbi:PIN domain-containing protein [Candidatus Micrarchaeota archaeon]|nr:PIN domain-containing protein [Candidatus Micrarchaeota archaeon]
MKLVVDANIIIAALIRQSATRLLLMDEGLELFSPEYMLAELEEHWQEIISKAKPEKEDFEKVLGVFKSRIKFVKPEMFAIFRKYARQASPDKKDAEYLALAMYLGEDAALWSNDKKLKQQNFVKIYSTLDLLKIAGFDENLLK